MLLASCSRPGPASARSAPAAPCGYADTDGCPRLSSSRPLTQGWGGGAVSRLDGRGISRFRPPACVTHPASRVSLTGRSPGPCFLGSRALRRSSRAALARWVRRTAGRGTLSPRGGESASLLTRLRRCRSNDDDRSFAMHSRCCVTCGDSNPTCLTGPFEPISFGWPRRRLLAPRGLLPCRWPPASALPALHCFAGSFALRSRSPLREPFSNSAGHFRVRRRGRNIRTSREFRKVFRVSAQKLSTAARKLLMHRFLPGA